MASEGWQVSWSQQLEGMTADIVHTGGVAVANGSRLLHYNASGVLLWRRGFQHSVHCLAQGGQDIGILSGSSFFLFNLDSGEPLNEGRRTSSGFSDISPRPGGGWGLSDRGDHLHFFNAVGRGIHRLRVGKVRRLIGWFDREHLMVQTLDGRLAFIKVTQEGGKRMLSDENWSWVSRLESGRLLLQSPDGKLWEGSPNPWGWDSLDRIEDETIDPISATRCGDGWWVLALTGELHRIPPIEEGLDMQVGDFLCSNGSDVMCTSTRDGLLRWWESPKLSTRRRQLLSSSSAAEEHSKEWGKRAHLFEAAQKAEEVGDDQKAVELYRALGRRDDVRRLLLKGELE